MENPNKNSQKNSSKKKNSTDQQQTNPGVKIRLVGTNSDSPPLEQWQVSLKNLSEEDRQKLNEDILNSLEKRWSGKKK